MVRGAINSTNFSVIDYSESDNVEKILQDYFAQLK